MWVCKNKVGAAQRAGGVSPPLENQHASYPIGGLMPSRSLSHLPARLRNAENTHKFFTHPRHVNGLATLSKYVSYTESSDFHC